MGLIEAVGYEWVRRHVREALEEDLGERGDITCEATVPPELQGRAELIAKQDGVLAGADWAVICGRLTDPPVEWKFLREDGAAVRKGETVAEVTGPLRGILVSERTALNGFGHLSGIATMAAEAVRLIGGTGARVLETRKTTPGWRLAEKYAVRMGGAFNHRLGLFDEILVKENHIEAAGGVVRALEAVMTWKMADEGRVNVPVEIEVRDPEELGELLAAVEARKELLPDRILLDNFSLRELQEAVERVGKRCELEASGGITLENIAAVAGTGVDRISLGALTHSVHPLDLSLLVR